MGAIRRSPCSISRLAIGLNLRVAPAYRFDQSVAVAEGLGLELGRQRLDGLVVNAVDAYPLDARIELGQARTLNNVDAVVIEVVRGGIAVLKRLGHLGFDVLVKGAAKSHIEQLQAAADAKNRLAQALEGGHQRLVVVVAQMVAAPAFVQRRLTVAAGPDIGAAVQHQAIEPLGVVVKSDVAALRGPGRARHHDDHGPRGHQPVSN